MCIEAGSTVSGLLAADLTLLDDSWKRATKRRMLAAYCSIVYQEMRTECQFSADSTLTPLLVQEIDQNGYAKPVNSTYLCT